MTGGTSKEVIDLYAEGLALYRKMKFAEALAKFESALKAEPADGPSMTMAGRCRDYIENPRDPNQWDGVYDMRSK